MKNKTKMIFWTSLVGIVSAAAFVGCANLTNRFSHDSQTTPGAAVRPDSQEDLVETDLKQGEATQMPNYYVHTVRWHGETLSFIAKWYTGKFTNWKVLAKANPTLNPNQIYKGSQIVIPEDVLKTREPMPKDFCAKLTPKSTPKKTAVKTAPQPKQEKDIPLFGPKEYSTE